MIIEKLDDHIFESDVESATHSRKPSSRMNYFDLSEQINSINKDTPNIGHLIINNQDISQIFPSRIGTKRTASLDLTDAAIFMNFNKNQSEISTA